MIMTMIILKSSSAFPGICLFSRRQGKGMRQVCSHSNSNLQIVLSVYYLSYLSGTALGTTYEDMSSSCSYESHTLTGGTEYLLQKSVGLKLCLRSDFLKTHLELGVLVQLTY
jgi:hypothetical protein